MNLEDYGIIKLTGESDILMMRLLCDLTAKGVEIIEKFFSIKIYLGSNWNTGSESDPHVASVLLPYSCLQDLERFCQHQGPDRNRHQFTGRIT